MPNNLIKTDVNHVILLHFINFRQSNYWCTVSEPSGLSKPNLTDFQNLTYPSRTSFRLSYWCDHLRAPMTDLQKRGPGRPKGTKNKPGARAGRPRNDAQKVQQKGGNSCVGKSSILRQI